MQHHPTLSALRRSIPLALALIGASTSASAQILLSENFDTTQLGQVPTGWTRSPGGSATMWYVGTTNPPGVCGNNNSQGGQQMLSDNGIGAFPNACAVGNSVSLLTPAVTPVHTGDVTLTFDHHIQLPANGSAEVWIWDDEPGGTSPTLIASDTSGLLPGGFDQWNFQQTLTVPYGVWSNFVGTNGAIQFEFRMNAFAFSPGSSGFGIDNVTIASSIPTPVPFCFCEAAQAPCGNGGPGVHGCQNSVTTFMSGGTLGYTGNPMITGGGFALTASNLPPNKSCLFYQGAGPLSTPSFLGDGRLCLSSPQVRLETTTSDAAGFATTTIDLAAAAGLTSGMVGVTTYYQAYYRDIANSPCGSGKNLTNALQVLWVSP